MNNELIDNNYIKKLHNSKTNSMIFSDKKPRDLINGTYHGIKNITIGFSLGVVSFVSLPIYFTVTEGLTGFVKGTTIGFFSGIGFPIVGMTYGMSQFLKGIYNTPNAVTSYYNGKTWDKDDRKWIIYDLNVEYIEIQKNLYNSKYLNNFVIDKKLYNILQLDTNCSQKDIRKAYHKLALKYHPDKNKNITSVDFKILNEAYSILSDPEKKLKYDTEGYENYKKKNFNSKDFYIYIFENENISDFIGELELIEYLNKNLNKTYINSTLKKKKEKHY